jgi:hypothetical protein
VVIGQDIRTGFNYGVFYGIAALRGILRLDSDETLQVLRVPLNPDPKCDDVETLVTMIRTVKGECCYSPGSLPP